MKTTYPQNIAGGLFFLLLFLSSNLVSAQRTAVVSGNWNSTVTWGGQSVPTGTMDVTINPNVAVTVTAAAVCGDLTVNGTLNLTASSNLDITNGRSVIINDSVVFNNTARIIGGGNGGNGIMLTINTGATIQTARTGAFTIPGGNASGLNGFGMNSGNKTWIYNSGINWIFNGTTAQTTGAAITNIGNITINNSAGVTLTNAATVTGTLTLTSGTFATSTNLTLATNAVIVSGGGLMTASSSAFGANAYDLTFTGNTRTAETVSSSGAGLRNVTVNLTNSAQTLSLGGPMTPDGNITITTGTLNLASSGSLSVVGDLSIGTGTTLITNNNPVNLSGNFVNNGTFTAGNSVITITGTATQSIAGFTTSSTGSVVFNKASGTATLTGNINSGAFTSAGGGALALGSFSHTFTGNWTRTNGTINAGSSTLTIGGTVTNTAGTFNAETGTVVYNGGSAQTLATVTYNNLTLSGAGDKTTTGITVNGILSIEGSGLISDAPTYGAQATLTYNTTTARDAGPEWVTPWNGNGGVIINNTGTISTNGVKRLNENLVINTGATLNLGDYNMTLTKDLIIDGTFTLGNVQITFAGNLNQTIDGFTTSNDVVMNKNSGTVTITGNINARDLDLRGTDGTIDFGTGLTHTFSRDWIRIEGHVACGSSTIIFGRSVVGSTGNFDAGTGTVEWNNAGDQTIAHVTYNNLVLSNSGTKNADSVVTVNGQLTVASGVVLNMNANELKGNSLTTSGTGLITTQAAASAIPSGRTWTMEVEYNAAGAQDIIGGTYENLTTSNSGTKSATGAITVNTQLEVPSGVTLSMGTNQLLGASLATSGTGTLITGVSGTNALPNGRTWSMNVEYNSTGNQSIASGTYQGNLTTDGDGINRAMQGSVTVQGILVLNSGTLDVEPSNTLNIMTSVTNADGKIDASDFDAQVNFANPSPIAIGDIFPGPVDILQISGGSTVTLTADEQIQFYLNLSNGKLSIDTNILTIFGTINSSPTNCLIGSKLSDIAIGGFADMGDSLFFEQTGTGNYLNNLTINRTFGGVIHIGNPVKVRGTLTPTAGTVNTNDHLVIASESTGSGRIIELQSGFSFNGQITVERYAKNKVARRYIFIASQVNDISLRNGWQDDIYITGPGTGGTPCGDDTGNGGTTDKYNSNGFDETILDLVSVYSYEQDNPSRWVAAPNTSMLLKAGKGYRVLYRGPRGVNDANCDTLLTTQSVPTPDSAVLNVKGNIVTGDWPVTLEAKTSASPTALGYTLVGNPYPCEILFSRLAEDNPPISAIPTYYTYDPNGPTDTTGYLTVNQGDYAGGYHSGGMAEYPNPDLIASGQAFFVASNRTYDTTLLFKERQKFNQSQPGVFRTSNTSNKKIRVHFMTRADKFIDNTLIRFNDDPAVSTSESMIWDAVTFNSGNFIAAIKGTRSFAIQTRPLNFTNDTVMVRIVSAAQGDFKLVFTDFAAFTEAAEIWLLDAFTGTTHNVKTDPNYPFTVTSSPASQGGRFKLVFRSLNAVMPVSFLNISATKKETGVEVKWETASEQDIISYDVERSDNGRDFYAIASVNSRGNSNTPVEYIYMDTRPLKGNAYYRIKSIETSSSKYSSIVKVNGSAVSNMLRLYPNPVKDKLTITSGNGSFNKGILSIRNIQGMAAIQTSLSNGGNSQVIDVSKLAAGVYFVIITQENGEMLKEKFVKY